MATTSPKRARRVKAAGSPAPGPMNPSCGHSGCGLSCNVRYCGPTSPMHNHHIVHAARGASHVWAAAIVAGLAVVLTGSIAFSAVQAQEEQRDPTLLMMLALRRIEMRLDRMEPKINRIMTHLQGEGTTGTMMMNDEKKMEKPPTSNVCMEQCGTTMAACMNEANTKMASCLKAEDGTDMTDEGKMAMKRTCEAARTTDKGVCETAGRTCKSSCTTAVPVQ